MKIVRKVVGFLESFFKKETRAVPISSFVNKYNQHDLEYERGINISLDEFMDTLRYHHHLNILGSDQPTLRYLNNVNGYNFTLRYLNKVNGYSFTVFCNFSDKVLVFWNNNYHKCFLVIRNITVDDHCETIEQTKEIILRETSNRISEVKFLLTQENLEQYINENADNINWEAISIPLFTRRLTLETFNKFATEFNYSILNKEDVPEGFNFKKYKIMS